MILVALKRAWQFLGDDRTALIVSGVVLIFALDAALRGHWWFSGILLAIFAGLAALAWRSLSPAVRETRKLQKVASMLAGYQPIGAHVDKPEHRTWRK